MIGADFRQTLFVSHFKKKNLAYDKQYSGAKSADRRERGRCIRYQGRIRERGKLDSMRAGHSSRNAERRRRLRQPPGRTGSGKKK